MAKESVKEVLEDIQQKGKGPNRFSKKQFNRLMKAILNDPSFTTKVAKVQNKELVEVEEIAVSDGFRKFLKKVLEKAGIDKNESEIVLKDSFTIENVDGLYEFFTTAMYEYMDAGNKFDFLPKEDFRGSLYIKSIGEKKKTRSVRNPQTKESMGDYEFTTQAHRELGASSPCPDYLKSKKKK